MAIDKELFPASDGLKYPVVARPYTDDMEVKEKFFTKADMVAMLTDIQLEIEELQLDRPLISRGYECYGFENKTPTEIRQECSDIIQQKIDSLKGENK